MAAPGPISLLLRIADTGGGHRTTAEAVGQVLDQLYPGWFDPVLRDARNGLGSANLPRWINRRSGPAARSYWRDLR